MSHKKVILGIVLGIIIALTSVFILTKINSESGAPTGFFYASGQKMEKKEEIKTEKTPSTREILSDYNALLFKLIELRSIQSNIVDKSKKVTEINEIIVNLDNKPISDKWDTMALCLANYCTDDEFLDFILIISLEGDKIDISYGNLIINLLTANKYWNTDNTIKFSQTITDTNNEISTINDKSITSKWNEIIDCNSTCSNKNELIFQIIKLIVEQYE